MATGRDGDWPSSQDAIDHPSRVEYLVLLSSYILRLSVDKTRLSSKGQVIIPKAVRDARGWEAGMTFEIENAGEAIILRPVRGFPGTRLDDVFGCLTWKGPAKSLDDMERAIVSEARKYRSK